MLIVRVAKEILNLPGRASEWAMAVIIVNLGWLMLLPSVHLVAPYYTLMAELLPKEAWAVSYLLIGVTRLGVLAVNGALKQSPGWRSLCAAACCFFWTNITVSLFAGDPFHNGALGIGVYPVLLVLDMVNMFRAIEDGGFFTRKEPPANGPH